ncbi:DUF1513 domain-containing protein [Hydrogenophaga taeniospiralis]|uniref:DUF1513 domain-containing protein n=1 Tax=Hydrogenophaga taeniospiralis TaxID=65656 RepID=UPI001CF9DC06|nr:DUF1513 domain-containing protein [Hydrogenophaga taeniospiralis]UCU94259.1 DUF1513 domain-containing protein [Hydrogenophaga taeniospiralis]
MALPSAWAARQHRTTLLAAWQQDQEQRIGLLSADASQWSAQRSLVVPTRAHGLWAEAGGSVLAVARRPGDWLLRWRPGQAKAQWHWIDGDRRFNGHVITSADGATLWTTETDLDTAQGRLGVRDAASLDKTGEWATHGMDPHQLLALPQAVGGLPAGTLMVANGGIPTLPETGRSKRELGRMDASLAALHPASGELLGQWRLDDPYLSIRHLAWDPVSNTLGIALQAEHPDQAAHQAAPVLAVWDGRTLRAAEGQPALAGYGGDICALPRGGFAVSCPRVNQLALFGAQGRWRQAIEHVEAYALASDRQQWWLASSRGQVGLLHGGTDGTDGAEPSRSRAPDRDTLAVQIENHWVLMVG